MKKLYLFMVTVLVWSLAINLVNAQTDNLIKNGDIEKGMGNWQKWTNAKCEFKTDTGMKSKTSLLIDKTDSKGGASYYQFISFDGVQGPKAVTITFWIKTEDVSGKGGTGAIIKIKRKGRKPSFKSLKPLITGTHDWQQHQLSFMIDENVKRVTLSLSLNAATGKVWFDNISMVISSTLQLGSNDVFPKRWNGNQIFEQWRETGPKSSKTGPALKRYMQNGNLVIEVPNSLDYRAKRIETAINFPTNKYKLFKVTISLGNKFPIIPFSFIVEFRGGKGSRNGYWNKIIASGSTLNTNTIIRYITVSEGAKRLVLRLYPVKLGRTVIKSVTVSEVTTQELKKDSIKMKVNQEKVVSRPDALQFAAQMVGIFPGLYYGTLPNNSKTSKRSEFIAFLDDCGIKAARYPGGSESHFFLAEGNEYTRKILKPHRAATVTSWQNFLDTMKEAKVKIIYQLNTSFYLSKDKKVKAICPSKITSGKHLKKFSDGKNHYSEAAEALAQCFEKGIFKAGDVDYWEIGNEEFAYMTVEQYANICAAFIKVLTKYDPQRPICVTGFKGLSKLLRQHGVYKYVTGITTHYPYASWPRPNPAYATASYKDFAHAWVDYPASLQAKANAISEKNVSVSETSICRLFSYDVFRMFPSFAAALAMAGNWPYLVNNDKVDMAVFHDFESPFFGIARFNVQFSNITRKFAWLKRGFRVPPKRKSGKNWFVNPNPSNTKVFFSKQYVISSLAQVMKLMSEFAGGKIYASEFKRGMRLRGVLAGESASGKKMIFVSNPYELPLLMEIDFPGFGSECEYISLDSDSYCAVLAREYRFRRGEIKLSSLNGKLVVILPPRSIMLLIGR